MPPVFTLWDALTFGLAAAIVSILVLLAYLHGRNRKVPWWRWAGMLLIVVGFWSGYISVLSWRYDLRKRVTCVTPHGTIFVKDGGVVPACADLTDEIDRTLAAWRAVPDVLLPGKLDVMVFIKPMPFEVHKSPGNRFAGLAKPFDNVIGVGFDGRPVAQTALAHELGHIILFRAGKNADEQTFRTYADQYGVPY